MVRAIAIHDGEALGAVPLRPAFRDIGNAAVEEGALAGKARIDGVGAFMRGAAPIARGDDIALARQFLLERHVIEIAANRDVRLSTCGADEALHQRLIGAPLVIGGVGDFGETDGRDAARTGRIKQARALEVGGDYLGDLAAKFAGRTGRRGNFGLRGQGGHDDLEVAVDVAGHIDRQLGHRRAGKGCAKGEQCGYSKASHRAFLA